MPIIGIDGNGIVNIWNQTAENIFGYKKSEIIGQPVSVIIPDRYKKAHREGLERFIKTGEARIIDRTVEVSGLTKEGVEILLAYQRIEQEQYLFTAIISDITERKKAQRCLNSQHEVIKVLTESNTTKEASTKILQVICELLYWKFGVMWLYHRQDHVLRCSEL